MQDVNCKIGEIYCTVWEKEKKKFRQTQNVCHNNLYSTTLWCNLSFSKNAIKIIQNKFADEINYLSNFRFETQIIWLQKSTSSHWCMLFALALCNLRTQLTSLNLVLYEIPSRAKTFLSRFPPSTNFSMESSKILKQA